MHYGLSVALIAGPHLHTASLLESFVCSDLPGFLSSWKNSRKLYVTTSFSLPITLKGKKLKIKQGDLTNQEYRGYTSPTPPNPPGADTPKAKWDLAFGQLLSLSHSPPLPQPES
jgi:hypothetical protein